MDKIIIGVKSSLNQLLIGKKRMTAGGNQFTILFAQLLLAKASGLALNANPIPRM